MSVLPEELAMVTDAVADFSIEDYIKAITTLVHELVYATKSFNNKYVFFFVSSEESAKLLKTNHRKINIKGRELEIKPIAYSKIRFCEVPAAICDNDIKRELEKLNINLFSEIQNQSYDKIVYIHPSDNEAIGIFIQCKSYQISVRRHMICSLCYDRTHNALNCPDAKEGQNTAESSNGRTGDKIPLALQKSATANNPNAPHAILTGSSNNKEPQPITKPDTTISREHTHYNTPSASKRPAIDNNPNAPDTILVGSSNNKEPRPITEPGTSISREHINYNIASASVRPAVANNPSAPDTFFAGNLNDKEPRPITKPGTSISREHINYNIAWTSLRPAVANNPSAPDTFLAGSSNNKEPWPITEPGTSISREHTNYNIASASVRPAIANNPNAPDTFLAGNLNDKEPRPTTKPGTSISREHTNCNTATASVNLIMDNNPNMLDKVNAGGSNNEKYDHIGIASTSREDTKYNTTSASINLTVNVPYTPAKVEKSSNDEGPHSKTEAPGKRFQKCPNYEIALKRIKSKINNNKMYPLKFKSFVRFLEDAYRKHNVLDVAWKYTRNIDALLFMLIHISELADQDTNKRLQRLYKNLMQQCSGLCKLKKRRLN